MSEARRECDGPDCSDPAVVQWTQVVNDKSTTQYLCKACAAAKGIGPDATDDIDLADLLGQGDDRESRSAPELRKPCGTCGQTLGEFRDSGRLGCSHCFTTFDTSLRGILERIHGSSRHVGKVYLPPDADGEDVNRRLGGLRRSLRRAIEVEDFERAALLRDEIRQHEADG